MCNIVCRSRHIVPFWNVGHSVSDLTEWTTFAQPHVVWPSFESRSTTQRTCGLTDGRRTHATNRQTGLSLIHSRWTSSRPPTSTRRCCKVRPFACAVVACALVQRVLTANCLLQGSSAWCSSRPSTSASAAGRCSSELSVCVCVQFRCMNTIKWYHSQCACVHVRCEQPAALWRLLL